MNALIQFLITNVARITSINIANAGIITSILFIGISFNREEPKPIKNKVASVDELAKEMIGIKLGQEITLEKRHTIASRLIILATS